MAAVQRRRFQTQGGRRKINTQGRFTFPAGDGGAAGFKLGIEGQSLNSELALTFAIFY
jgi:hypothetical protein